MEWSAACIGGHIGIIVNIVALVSLYGCSLGHLK